MRFEILPGLPPYGPRAISFSRRQLEFQEGLVVRFYPRASEPWVGNFLGGMTKCNVVLSHPNETDVLVVADGEAFVVDPERRTLRDRFGADIEEVIPLPALKSVLFRGMVDFEAVTAANSRWRSNRISWDGLRNIKVHGFELTGEAYTPVGDAWVPFKLDLLTGHCPDAIYQKDIGTAVPVARRAD